MSLPRWLVLAREKTAKQEKGSVRAIRDEERFVVLDVDGNNAYYAADIEADDKAKIIRITGKQAKRSIRKGEGHVTNGSFRFTKTDSFLSVIQANRARKLSKEGKRAMPSYYDDEERKREQNKPFQAPDQENFNPSSECRLGRSEGWVRVSPYWRAGNTQRYAKTSRMGKNAKGKAQEWKKEYLKDRVYSSVPGYREGGAGGIETRVCLIRRLDSPDDKMKTWAYTVLGRMTSHVEEGALTDYAHAESRESIVQKPRAKGSGAVHPSEEPSGERTQGAVSTVKGKAFSERAKNWRLYRKPAEALADCPKCGALAGNICISPNTGKRTSIHRIRVETYFDDMGLYREEKEKVKE